MTHYISAEVKATDTRGGWKAVASMATVDRDGERVLPHALVWRTPTVPVHIDHVMTVERLVGRCTPSYDPQGRLVVDGVFGTSKLAQECRAAVMDGSLDSMSIAFMNAQRRKGKDGVTEVIAGELIAVDFVSVPSNREAVVLSSRSFTGGGMTVAEARAFLQATIKDIAALELADAECVLDQSRGPASQFVRNYLRGL